MKNTKIHILKDDVARRIAAGEVIDRPAAVLRELLDNAIDAQASEISVYLEDGGNTRIRVVDNGTGMGKEDLLLCALPHATSKITTLEDLDKTVSLGFRGEALSSIGACSRLNITSLIKGSREPANILAVEGGSKPRINESPGNPGTIVDVADIFFNMPARKKFLKRAGTESTMCHTMFLEKASAFPQITFKLFTDDKLKTFLPAAALEKRISSIYSDAFSTAPVEIIKTEHTGFSVTVLAAPPHITRRDRKLIQIFVNNRRINEYSLLQAVEYGFTGYIPGGLHPCAFVFVTANPALLDFNIHPAKREARFRNLPEIHSALVLCLKSHLAKNHKTQPITMDDNIFYSRPGTGRQQSFFFQHQDIPQAIQSFPFSLNLYKKEIVMPKPISPVITKKEESPVAYYGQLWNVFLLASQADTFFLVDQHAAHERILFDELQEKTSASQPLLIPIQFEIESDESEQVKNSLPVLNKIGFEVIKDKLLVTVAAVPAELSGVSEKEIIDCIIGSTGTPEEMRRNVLSVIACRAAIKEGDIIDPLTAVELIKKTLSLPQQRCPHGRPVIQLLSKEELYRRFNRTV